MLPLLFLPFILPAGLGVQDTVTSGAFQAETNAVRTLEARQAELFAALKAREATRVAAVFGEDGVLHVAGMPPVEGRAAIGQFYAKMFGFLVESTTTPGATHVSASGDLAYATGRTSNAFRGADAPITYAGKYVLVWRKVGGQWLAAFYGISSNEPERTR